MRVEPGDLPGNTGDRVLWALQGRGSFVPFDQPPTNPITMEHTNEHRRNANDGPGHGTDGTVEPMRPPARHRRLLRTIAWALLFGIQCTDGLWAQTANGELEGRPAPVARRKCVGGAGAGSLCNADGDCPGSTCVDRNVFNISVAVLFN